MTEPGLETCHPLTADEWRKWLEEHHARTQGIWLVSYKQSTAKPRVHYDDAVEIALCFGWIDSKPRTLDAERSMLWFSPRKKGTAWSKKNKERIEKLTASGQLHAVGRLKVEEARLDGSWNKLDSVEALDIPTDLQAALAAHTGSAAHFDAFPRSTKRAILEWIGNAKTEGTRSKRVTETARLAEQNIRANQWVKKP